MLDDFNSAVLLGDSINRKVMAPLFFAFYDPLQDPFDCRKEVSSSWVASPLYLPDAPYLLYRHLHLPG